MDTPPHPQNETDPGAAHDAPAGASPDAATEASAEELAAAGIDPHERPRLVPEGLLNQMVADPVRAPEYLALAAVERFGPEAQRWIAGVRARFPHVTEAHLATLTRTRFVRLGRYSGAVAGLAGVVGAVIDVPVLAWNQARMVIYLATIYGEDPTSRDRAVELLMLQGVHKVMDAAQTALDIAARRASPTDLLKHSDTIQRSRGSLAALAQVLAKMAGVKLAKKGAMKLIPFAAVPFGAMANAASTKRLADKAIAMYAHRRFYGRPALPG